MIKISNKPQSITYKNHQIQIKRRKSGITEVTAKDKNSSAFAQALCHCEDRFMQLFLLRIIGRGRICELLKDDDESLKIDIFMRQMNFYGATHEDMNQLPKEVLDYFQAYADGVNYHLEKRGKSWEFKFLNVHLDPWSIQDSLMVIKIMSFIGLAQTQGDAEKFIIQSLREGVEIEKFKSLFTPHLDGLTEDIVKDLKKLKYFEGLIPDEIKFNQFLPKMMASNNWIVAPSKSETDSVIACNDPHLEVNRLPAIWYEQVVHIGERNFQGVSMPGLPGIIMGRSDKVSFGFTYGFMDMVDYFIEEITGERCLRDGEYCEQTIREEVILRKKSSDFKFKIYENDCGILESNPFSEELEDGYYLTRAWSAHHLGAKGSAIALYEMIECDDVHTMKEALSKISISCNWLLGDSLGNIAYQQSGMAPKRNSSGLYPLRASDPLNHWQDLLETQDLLSVINPEKGFLATANNDLCDFANESSPLTINLPMGPYRVDRINHLLSEKEKFSLEELKNMQSDLYSIQAHYFMEELRALLSSDKVSKELDQWDLCYDRNSRGATLFEDFYFNLLEEVFTKDFYPTDAWKFIANRSSILVDFYHFFDQIIITENPLWFKERSKMDCFRNALAKTQKKYSRKDIPTWGELRRVKMNNILFDGKLPSFLGFDYGPISIEGSRATIVQGALYESHGRISTFCPSMRFVTDLSTRESHTVLAGGVSDRRFSKLYTSEIEDWLNFRYKVESLERE
ncbi:penicillin acylase family protein [Halobacteriovorax marinus]|uniref:penicillin acylase family protein n=1 Tax=Halobacteriovorax marinus TaxID=97084 RepID=UPI003A8D7540